MNIQFNRFIIYFIAIPIRHSLFVIFFGRAWIGYTILYVYCGVPLSSQLLRQYFIQPFIPTSPILATPLHSLRYIITCAALSAYINWLDLRLFHLIT